MNDFNTHPTQAQSSTDVGLRNFMLGTYRYMAMAMAVTAGVAYFVGQMIPQVPALYDILYNPISLIGFIIAIPLLFGAVGSKLHSMSKGGVLAFLFGFAAFLGLFMAAVSIHTPGMVIAKIFFMTVAMFAALSLFGYTTERNLSTFIKYAIAAFMAYVGISVLGMIFPALRPTGPLEIIINVVALAAIAFITAWETQMLKRIYYSVAGNAAMLGKMSAYGAASLLLAFVNMFQILLSLFGNE
jgi:FtsH-binding integral membrane protein